MSKKGKNFANAKQKIEAEKVYTPKEAIELVKDFFSGFDDQISHFCSELFQSIVFA